MLGAIPPHDDDRVLVDYRTGDVLAYVGSAGYARDDLASAKFEPKYDVAGDGARQPGSAWKPILYASAFDAKRLTPGSLLLDITTEFDRGQDWAPRDADQLERGPVLVRREPAAEQRPCAEHVEAARGDEADRDPHRVAVPRQVPAVHGPMGHGREAGAALGVGPHLGRVHPRLVEPAPAVPDHHPPGRVMVGQRREHDRVREAEDRRAGGDPERKRPRRERREGRRAQHPPQGVAQLEHGVAGPRVTSGERLPPGPARPPPPASRPRRGG